MTLGLTGGGGGSGGGGGGGLGVGVGVGSPENSGRLEILWQHGCQYADDMYSMVQIIICEYWFR